jgi:hypothetical protein
MDTYFWAPVGRKEKKRRLRERVAGLFLSVRARPLFSPNNLQL